MHPLALQIFASSLAGLAYCAASAVCVEAARRETESRRILIIGGGPVARSVARALRNDPLQRATVCGFVDDDQLFLAQHWGASPIWTGSLAPNSSMRSSSLSRQPSRRESCGAAFRNTWTSCVRSASRPWLDSGIDHIGEVPSSPCIASLASAIIFEAFAGYHRRGVRSCVAQSSQAIVALLIGWTRPVPPSMPRKHGAKAPLSLLQVSLHGDQRGPPQGRPACPHQRQANLQNRRRPRITRMAISPRYSLDRAASALERVAREMSWLDHGSSDRRSQPLRTSPVPAPGRETCITASGR